MILIQFLLQVIQQHKHEEFSLLDRFICCFLQNGRTVE